MKDFKKTIGVLMILLAMSPKLAKSATLVGLATGLSSGVLPALDKDSLDKKFHEAKITCEGFAQTGNLNGKIQQLINPVVLFKQVSEKLAGLKTISYQYAREFNYPSEGYVSKTEGEMYIDFAKESDLVGMRFQYQDEQGFVIFNNAELFNAKKKTKTITVTKIKSQQNLEGRSPLYNSFVTLRNALPLLIKDESIKKSASDTLINGSSYYLLQFFLHNRLFNYLGNDFSKVTKELTFRYQLIVNKNTMLPVTLLQTTLSSQDLNRTDFKEIATDPAMLQESSWFYSSYLNEYTIEAAKIPLTTIKAGEIAPDWELNDFANDGKVSLAQYRGKVVLLEFWIKNCSFCIEAVPKLNVLNKTYTNGDFKLLAINTEDNKYNVGVFVDKHPVNYSVLYGDDITINKKYGIGSFPQVVLISKDGRVLYSGVLDLERLKQLIGQSL